MVAAAAIALPVISASNSKTDAPVIATAMTTLGAAAATLVVLFRVLDPVGDGSRDAGLFLGLAATAGVAVAAWLAVSDEGT